MKLPVYIVDAFTDKLFGGNPAAVCPLEDWLRDELMQSIATENNFAATAFFVKNNRPHTIRWFTPAREVKICGHATLASAHIMFTELGFTENVIELDSLSGLLKVGRTADGKIQLDFPASMPAKTNDIPDALLKGLGIKNAQVYKSFDYVVVLPSQADVEILDPDFKTLAKVKARGVIATARANDADFISRCFYPQSGIDEDPVTGSAHTITVPYWAEQLGKTKLKAIQLSKRRGYLDCELAGDRVLMSGEAVTYLKGEYSI